MLYEYTLVAILLESLAGSYQKASDTKDKAEEMVRTCQHHLKEKKE